MKFKKLRIAWSMWWGLMAVLLIGLWVRSYWIKDELWVRVYGPSSAPTSLAQVHDKYVRLGLNRGRVFVQVRKNMNMQPLWLLTHTAAVDSGAGFPDASGQMPTLLWIRVFRWPHLTEVEIPLWCLILIAGILSAVSWAHRLKRFSLRTLLITITLFALALGTIVWLSHR